MAYDFDHLARRMASIAAGINRAVDLTVKDAARLAVLEAARGTPVDTGTARSNWAIGLGAPVVGNRRPAFKAYRSRYAYPRGPGGDRSENANITPLIALAAARTKQRKVDQDVYITNAVPYIARLNKGHSQQSGSGFVARAAAKAAKDTVERAVFHLRKELK